MKQETETYTTTTNIIEERQAVKQNCEAIAHASEEMHIIVTNIIQYT